jgi:hypothetical protein
MSLLNVLAGVGKGYSASVRDERERKRREAIATDNAEAERAEQERKARKAQVDATERELKALPPGDAKTRALQQFYNQRASMLQDSNAPKVSSSADVLTNIGSIDKIRQDAYKGVFAADEAEQEKLAEDTFVSNNRTDTNLLNSVPSKTDEVGEFNRLTKDFGVDIDTDSTITNRQLHELYQGGAEGGAQKFANIQKAQRQELANNIGTAKVKELSKIEDGISGLDNLEDAQRAQAKAKELGSVKLVQDIQTKIDGGFDSGVVQDKAENALYVEQMKEARKGNITAAGAIAEVEASLGRELTVKEKARYVKAFGQYALRVNLSASQDSDIAESLGLIQLASEVQEKLLNQKVIDNVGPIDGVQAAFSRWISGDAITDARPKEVTQMLTALGLLTNNISRKESGAALTEAEIAFFQSIIGTIRKDPEGMGVSLQTVKDNYARTIRNTYMVPLQRKFGLDRDGLSDALSQVESLYEAHMLTVQQRKELLRQTLSGQIQGN